MNSIQMLHIDKVGEMSLVIVDFWVSLPATQAMVLGGQIGADFSISGTNALGWAIFIGGAIWRFLCS